MLVAKNITLAYQQKEIFSNLNLEIPSEKITVLIGANGCGKSTLLKAFARQLVPNKGEILLGDRNIYQTSSKEIAKVFSMLSQNQAVLSGLTVKQLVRYGRYPYQSLLSHWSEEDDICVERALVLTGCESFANHSLEALSGGQRQRAWIAMTLAQNTPYIFLDEPTTYLDLPYQLEVLELLRKLNKEEHKTIVMVLHDVNLTARFADWIVAIKDRRVAYVGDVNEIITEEKIYDIFSLKNKVIQDPYHNTPMCIPLSYH